VIQNWGFFLEMKGEAETLLENAKLIFPELDKKETKPLDETDYMNGLPLVLNNYVRQVYDIDNFRGAATSSNRVFMPVCHETLLVESLSLQGAIIMCIFW